MAYGTNHLAKQESEIGFLVGSVENLKNKKDYLIVDPGLNEFNGGYKYLGKCTNDKYHLFEDMLEIPTNGQRRNVHVFTDEELREMIHLGQVAEEA